MPPAPTQRQILDRRRGLIPPVPVHAAPPAPATAEQVERLIAAQQETNRLLGECAAALQVLRTLHLAGGGR